MEFCQRVAIAAVTVLAVGLNPTHGRSSNLLLANLTGWV